jgi:hypothetical protein
MLHDHLIDNGVFTSSDNFLLKRVSDNVIVNANLQNTSVDLRQLGICKGEVLVLEYIDLTSISTHVKQEVPSSSSCDDIAEYVYGDSVAECFLLMANTFIVDSYGFVLVMETANAVKGFAPSIRGNRSSTNAFIVAIQSCL